MQQKGSMAFKKLSEADCRKAMAWHLQSSPYHELDANEARSLADQADVAAWDEQEPEYVAQATDTGEQWVQRRKRKTRPAASALPPARESSAGSSSLVLNTGASGRLAAQRIEISRIELQACADSLRRAKRAAQSACQLYAKAAILASFILTIHAIRFRITVEDLSFLANFIVCPRSSSPWD